MKRITTSIILILSAILAFAKTYSVKDIPNVHVADRSRYVSNPDGILSPQAEQMLNDTLQSIWDKTSSEVVVVVVEQIDDDIDTFATELFSEWGIGKKDKSNGLLVLISRDDRKAVIRTGYGMEGLMPDIISGRIIRNIMAPNFREGNYDAGTIASVNEISRIVTTPGATEELLSKYNNDMRQDEEDLKTFIANIWGTWGLMLTLILLGWYIVVYIKGRHHDRYERALEFKKMLIPAVVIAIIGLLAPAIMVLVIWLTSRYMRLRRRRCPNCHSKMRRLDEKTDNEYLTPAQDLEEQLNSVDYDVWLCDKCGETDILPYVNPTSTYKMCPKCHTRAMSLRSDRIVVQPTTRSEGLGIKEYVCRNCGNRHEDRYRIPKNPDLTSAAIAGGIAAGMGGRGGGGGGFSGGSFGGGFTGGGGASGGW